MLPAAPVTAILLAGSLLIELKSNFDCPKRILLELIYFKTFESIYVY
jgi:hypothetical protein